VQIILSDLKQTLMLIGPSIWPAKTGNQQLTTAVENRTCLHKKKLAGSRKQEDEC
jgi:hypothetical protein